jgi:hypothetical protein
MTERTKVVILILSQTVVIALDYAIETMLGMSAENDLKFFALILLNLLIYIGFGFFTENAKKLLIQKLFRLVMYVTNCKRSVFSPVNGLS